MANEAFLLKVKEEANAILAEIVRLASFIPQDFINPNSSAFKLLILDFNYFSKSAYYEKIIGEKEDLQDHFYSRHGYLLSQFSTLFQTLATFLCSLKEYIHHVGSDRIGISYLDVLDTEILYHIGLVLLYFEKFLPGAVSERIYVAIYRNSDDQRNVDFLIDFLRACSTSEANYLFERLKISESFVDKCLCCCETIYKEGVNDFGKLHVERHTLAKWVFICLLFKPTILKTEVSKMRKVVDDFFRDDWVLQLGLGLNVNLMEKWQHYRAAFTAITTQVDIKKAKQLATDHYNTLGRLTIPQGKLAPVDFDAHSRLIIQYNSSLKWLFLHTSETVTKKGISRIRAADIHPQLGSDLLTMLLRVSNFEMNFLTTYDDCLQNKEENVKKLTSLACSTISEIMQLLSLDSGPQKADKITKLHEWFSLVKGTIEGLVHNDKRNGEFVIQIKKKIIQVGEMMDLSGRLALAQHLQKLHSHLDRLFALYNVSEEEVRRLQRIAEPSYLWPILDDWTARIQRWILDSSNAQAVRALFFKLSLSVYVLCEQLENQIQKKLVGRAYSFYLERRLRVILQSIPQKLFSILKDTLSPLLQLRWEPNIDKNSIREMADFDDNFRFAEITYKISNLSLGVSRMALRKVGVLTVNPKELLEEGIRRELVLELPLLLTVSDPSLSLEGILTVLSDTLHSFNRAFIYICEHVNVNGYDMWREVIDDLLTQMTRNLLQKKVIADQAAANHANSVQALPIIVDLLLKHSNPVHARFMEDSMTWRDVKTKKDVLSSKIVDLIERWIPSSAVNSLRIIFCHDMEICISDVSNLLRTLLTSVGPFTFNDTFVTSNQFDQLLRLIQGNSTLPRLIFKVGQLLLLLSILCQTRKQHCQLHATPLFSALSACDKYLLYSSNTIPSDVAPLLKLLRDCGFCNQSLAIYKSSTTIPSNAVVCLVISLFCTMHKLNGLRQEGFCCRSFIAGLFCLLHQANAIKEFETVMERFLASPIVIKSTRDKQLLLFYSSNVTEFL